MAIGHWLATLRTRLGTNGAGVWLKPARRRQSLPNVAPNVEVCELRFVLSAPYGLTISGPGAPIDVGSTATCSGVFNDDNLAMDTFPQQWNVSGPGISSPITGSGDFITFTASAAGNFTVTYVVTDNDR